MRTHLESWRSSLCAALGLVTVTCGGQSVGGDQSAGEGGAGAGSGAAGGLAGGSGGSGGQSGAAGDHAGNDGAPESGLASICTNPEPIVGVTGEETGFVRCAGGFIHRVERRDCASIVPRTDPVSDSQDTRFLECIRDADCAHLPRGFCRVFRPEEPPVDHSVCESGCTRDEDCGTDQVCLCGSPIGRCVGATCRSDAECGGYLCASARYTAVCGPSTTAPSFAIIHTMSAIAPATVRSSTTARPARTDAGVTTSGCAGGPFWSTESTARRSSGRSQRVGQRA
jgi:hypothetical protein